MNLIFILRSQPSSMVHMTLHKAVVLFLDMVNTDCSLRLNCRSKGGWGGNNNARTGLFQCNSNWKWENFDEGRFGFALSMESTMGKKWVYLTLAKVSHPPSLTLQVATPIHLRSGESISRRSSAKKNDDAKDGCGLWVRGIASMEGKCLPCWKATVQFKSCVVLKVIKKQTGKIYTLESLYGKSDIDSFYFLYWLISEFYTTIKGPRDHLGRMGQEAGLVWWVCGPWSEHPSKALLTTRPRFVPAVLVVVVVVPIDRHTFFWTFEWLPDFPRVGWMYWIKRRLRCDLRVGDLTGSYRERGGQRISLVVWG